MTLPILYSFRRCPYAMRARLALLSSGQQVHLREIVLRDKAPAFLEISTTATVPLLVLEGGRQIEESYDIMRWALGQNDPLGWLRPEIGTLEGVEALIAEADGDFKTQLDRYKYASRFEGGRGLDARQLAVGFLQELEARLLGQAYLFGRAPCLADMATAPFVRQFAHVDLDWFEAQNWPGLIRWLAAFKASEGFAVIMQKYPKWQQGDAVTLFPEAL